MRQDGARHLEHLLRPARRGARSGQLGLPLLLPPRPGSTSPSSTPRSSSASPRSRRGAPPGREPALQHAARRSAGRSPKRTLAYRAPRRLARADRAKQKVAINQFHIAAITEHFRGAARKEEGQRRRPAARRAPGQLHHRGHQGRPGRRPRPANAPRAPRRSTSSTGR